MKKKSPGKIEECSRDLNLNIIMVTANLLLNLPSIYTQINFLPFNLNNNLTSPNKTRENDFVPEKREIDDAVTLGLKEVEDLVTIKEPLWYRMGLFLDPSEPGSSVANFGKPRNKANELLKFGYSSVEISRRISELYSESDEKQRRFSLPESRVSLENCPFKGTPRCPPSSKFYRTSDGSCNNPNNPWWGSAFLPMERFLPPVYEDGVQSIRRSKTGRSLPSARDVSVNVHRDKNRELPTITLMFMQWGQFIDHDLVSTVKSRSFNGSIARCCDRSGQNVLPIDLLHPSCLPILVSDDDWFLGRFGVRCMEFTRSAPATRINCDLGWREQINQATSFLDASNIYGSDDETTDSIRTFRNGKLQYGRPLDGPLQPPDPPGGELCRSGALTTECFPSGDSRVGEQIGLTAIHTVWVRYHNRLATTLGKMNKHWSDEKIFQETRRIIGAMIQHITYREFLPIVLGSEVMSLFELDLNRKKFFNGYNGKINPQIANSFGTGAFRFGHSLVQNSYMRYDSRHRPIFNNVTLHQELNNMEHIWSFGSVDRLMLGLSNQPCQRRDEFICEELTNNLFRHPRAPFGIDLAAINIQRGRDHGLPPYVSWRKPCGLTEIKNWSDLQKVMGVETVQRLKFLYEDVEDIDLFTAGLAEKPVRGGIVGPTFACIIAQQFSNLRKGDRFWYENGDFPSSFTPAQLQQIRRISFAEILCQTMRDIDTIQPFIFLAPDKLRNERFSCDSHLLNRFDLAPWTEDLDELQRERPKRQTTKNKRSYDDYYDDDDRPKYFEEARKRKRVTVKPITIRPTTRPNKVTKLQPTKLKIPISNVTLSTIHVETKYHDEYENYNERPQVPQFSYYTTRKPYKIKDRHDYNYILSLAQSTTPKTKTKSQTPLEVNIKIQYYPPTTTSAPKRKKQKFKNRNTATSYPIYIQQTTQRPTYLTAYHDGYYQQNDQYQRPLNDDIYVIKRPVLSKRPSVIFTNQDHYASASEMSQYPNVVPYEEPEYEQTSSESNQQYDNYDYHQYQPVEVTTKRIYNSIYYHTHKPSPVYNNPSGNGYIDDIDRLFEEDKPPQKDIKGTSYSIAYIEKLSSPNSDDKLDFKTRFVYKRVRRRPQSKTNSDELEAKEGGIELEKENDDFEKIKLVDLKVSPSENGNTKWSVYNVSKEEDILEIIFPDFNKNISCSDEIPSKLKN